MENERRVQQKAPASRYALLDELRGLDLVSMMLYHACWDMMFLFGIWMDWYAGMPGRLWQQTICWVFILLPGFCVPLGHRTLKRGAQVFAAGALVTVVTLVFMPEDRVVFGVLEPLLKKVMPAVGLAVSAVLFAVCYPVSLGWVGRRRMEPLRRSVCPALGWMGRHSLLLYLLHQPVIYGVLSAAAVLFA